MSFGGGHSHAQGHSHGDAAAGAAAQATATVIGWIDGEPVGRELLDARIRVLRSGRLADRLPAVGSKEDRQFVRWTAQVVLTEEVARREAARRMPNQPEGPLAGSGSATVQRTLGQVEALHLGSINAAAWAECGELAALFDAVVGAAEQEATAVPQLRDWWRVRHAMAGSAAEVHELPLTALGWTTLDDLPDALATAIREAPPGMEVGPVESGLGWHRAIAIEVERREAGPEAVSAEGDRLRRFALWLDQLRRAHLTLAEGFEHPGDPSQPDNTHRH